MMNRNRFYNIVAFCIILTMAFLLSGCQLAQDVGDIKSNDKLCGLFITIGVQNYQFGELNLDNAVLGDDNGVFFSSDDLASANYNRIEGIIHDDGTADFEGTKGYYMGITQELDNQGGIIGNSMVAPGFQDVKLNVNITDDTEENSCEATLCVARSFHETVNINPVYQRTNGSYYMVVGELMGYMFSSDSNGTGQVFTQTIDNTFKTISDGTSKTEKDSFIFHIAVAEEAQDILIKEMNEKDELIKTTQYLRTDPDQFNVDSETKYVIVEEYTDNASNVGYVNRSIYSLNKKEADDKKISHSCNFSEDNGVISVKMVEFVYQ